MILDANGNPIEKDKTTKDKVAGGIKLSKTLWVTIAAVVGCAGGMLTNIQALTEFFYPPKASIEIVKVFSKPGILEVTLKNDGGSSGLITACDLDIESTFQFDAPLAVRLGFLNVDKEFPLKLEPDRKEYELEDFRLELKPEETVVFNVRFDHEDVRWICFAGNLRFELEGNQELQSERFELMMAKYEILPAAWPSLDKDLPKLIGGLQSFSKLSGSPVEGFAETLSNLK